MDDTDGGAHSEEEIMKIYKELTTVMKGAGLNLRKWSSNSKCLLEIIPSSQQELIKKENTIKTL